jgi:hypothetical protein
MSAPHAMQAPAAMFFSLCPFRTPAEHLEPKRVESVFAGATPGPPIAATCLGPTCGMWKVTQVNSQGVPVQGMCGLRYLAECQGENAGAMQRLVRIGGALVEKFTGIKMNDLLGEAVPPKGN